MKLTAPAYSRATLIMGCGVQEKSEGCYIYDQYGRRFLDLFDAYGNQSFGYGHPRILAALRRQLDSGHTNSCKIFFEEGPTRVGEALAALTNGALPCSFLTNGGAEAIDGVLKLARAHTRRPKFITTENAYHGKTFAALSAACRPEYEKMFEPMMPQFQAVPFGDIEAMEKAIDDQTAAVLLEPIQAEGGIVVPDDEYFPRLRQLCTERGALLICDETQTGFGRTGRFFCFEHFGIVPDLISIGKSFGGGMLPIAAILCREEYWTPFRVAPLSFGSSLGGNPLACAVGLETLAMASDPEFLADMRRKGDYVGERLHAIAKAYPQLVAKVRGKGLLWGVKLYDDAVGGLLIRQLFERGAISTFCLFDSCVFRIEPPLIITTDQLRDGLDALEEAFEMTAALCGLPAKERARRIASGTDARFCRRREDRVGRTVRSREALPLFAVGDGLQTRWPGRVHLRRPASTISAWSGPTQSRSIPCARPSSSALRAGSGTASSVRGRSNPAATGRV